MKASDIFRDLFVLELANNHWGRLARGLAIVDAFGAVVRAHGMRAAMKLQFRDVESFIHPGFRDRTDLRYVKKTLDTRMPWADYARLVEATRRAGMITMATPFDEPSVERCVEFGVEIIKIASSDIGDWPLIERIAATRKPAIMSTGGSALADIDAMVAFFNGRDIPFAINHCVSIYPSEDGELDLNQIDFLRARYPDNVIGFSTHEYRDWRDSMLIAYAKGARTFERHVDIDADGIPVSPYCSRPADIDAWFGAFRKAGEMCGGPAEAKRVPPEKEVRYLDALVRGVYAKRPLAAGEALSFENTFLAIPLQQGQISCREIRGGEVLLAAAGEGEPIRLAALDCVYAQDPALARLVDERGLPPTAGLHHALEKMRPVETVPVASPRKRA